MAIETTEYYDDFKRYYKLAETQQRLCNLGIVPHENSGVNDSLMENVHLYDVVERKYAGFSQIINDCFYAKDEEHPYYKKMKLAEELGDHTLVTRERKQVIEDWSSQNTFDVSDWLYIFILHRVTGSGINYSKKPSGYHNTLLFHLHQGKNLYDMVQIMKHYPATFYTSGGYQFPQFPKPADGWKRGGDYYLGEFAPKLARDLESYLIAKGKSTLREIIDFMLRWNVEHGLKQYKFQYAAVAADIADWLPNFVYRDSLFAYGSNARECISYLAKPVGKMKQDDFLDEVILKGCEDLGALPYNLEDVCCDYIRYLENYCGTGGDYDHLDLSTIWNSSPIKHPHGRQKWHTTTTSLTESTKTLTAH